MWDTLSDNPAYPALYVNRDITGIGILMFKCVAVKNGSDFLLGS